MTDFTTRDGTQIFYKEWVPGNRSPSATGHRCS
jgi:hypothetical protein